MPRLGKSLLNTGRGCGGGSDPSLNRMPWFKPTRPNTAFPKMAAPMGWPFLDRGASAGADGAPPNHGELDRAPGSPLTLGVGQDPAVAHEAAQRRAVQQRVLGRRVGQVELVLHEVHPQHALQTVCANRRA